MMALFGYFNTLSTAIVKQDSLLLSSLFKKSINKLHPATRNVDQAIETKSLSEIDEFCDGRLGNKQFEEMLAFHFKGIICLQKKFYSEAYIHQANLIQALMRYLEDTEASGWLMAATNTTSLDLRVVAKLADKEQKKKGQKEDKQSDAARILNSCFSICFKDKAPLNVSKKWGILGVSNQLFKIYFSLNNIRLGRTLVNSVRPMKNPSLEDSRFPISQLVTFKF
eukprot:TRINITY_DN9022_c0_g1_i3.p1 TRINITY_DN9022_c0_g1~~TRINITY_DN9022_c0_g1_i3.p1  ORF type:complete len:224 (+),score=25.49 TRINITY_DN9022_c0_g1_i3:3-674(+)